MADRALLRLISELASYPKHYVVFVGAGLSKDADVPGGWDILLETLKDHYVEENDIDDRNNINSDDIWNWYKNHLVFKNLGYFEIVELMKKGNVVRSEYLKQFFIDKEPGDSHRELASLVKSGSIRFIFSVNFDDLIERALVEIGISNFDVIYSDEDLKQKPSWDKESTCRIYKLHGDYQRGNVKNTISEVRKLTSLIAKDFQYIIDRHGLIVLGYSGRDEGIMNHFLKRKPDDYPIYWQYRKAIPTDKKEFELFLNLVEHYEKKHKMEIDFIKNDSASNFLQTINDGVAKYTRTLLSAEDSIENFEYRIIRGNERTTRAMTLDVLKKFNDAYEEFIEKEDEEESNKNKFQIFSDFTQRISFLFDFLEVLLRFEQDGEATWLIRKVFSRCTNFDWYESNEFIRKSSPYYILMNFGAIILEKKKIELFYIFFNMRYKSNSRKYRSLLKDISKSGRDWTDIKPSLSVNHNLPRYRTMENELLPSIVSKVEFNRFDSYMLLKICSEKASYYWFPGSVCNPRDSYLEDIYNEFFHEALTNKDKAIFLVNKLIIFNNNIGMELNLGLESLIYSLINIHHISNDQLKLID